MRPLSAGSTMTSAPSGATTRPSRSATSAACLATRSAGSIATSSSLSTCPSTTRSASGELHAGGDRSLRARSVSAGARPGASGHLSRDRLRGGERLGVLVDQERVDRRRAAPVGRERARDPPGHRAETGAEVDDAKRTVRGQRRAPARTSSRTAPAPFGTSRANENAIRASSGTTTRAPSPASPALYACESSTRRGASLATSAVEGAPRRRRTASMTSCQAFSSGRTRWRGMGARGYRLHKGAAGALMVELPCFSRFSAYFSGPEDP